MDGSLPLEAESLPDRGSASIGTSNQASMSVPREPQTDTSVSETDTFTSPRTRAYIQNISDSLISSDATVDRYQEPVDGDESVAHPRISEEPELEGSEAQESVENDDDEQQDEEGTEDDDDDASTASSTRHLREDELEQLILQNLGFHGNFHAPGKIIPTGDYPSSEDEFMSYFDVEGETNGLDDSVDELAIRSRSPIVKGGASRQHKRKRGSSIRRQSDFNVDKRRKQWISETEDRALRRGPVMGVSLEDFKEGRCLSEIHVPTMLNPG